WIAVTTDPTVDPTQPTRRVEMPQAIPHGLSVEGLGLRPGMLHRRLAMAALPLDGGQMELGEMFGGETRRLRSEALGSRGLRVLRRVLSLGPRRGRHLKGRIVLSAPDRLVVDFTVPDSGLVWAPPPIVRLTFAGRPTIEVPLVFEQCTAAGRIGAGLT